MKNLAGNPKQQSLTLYKRNKTIASPQNQH